jgi:hypothetical protein
MFEKSLEIHLAGGRNVFLASVPFMLINTVMTFNARRHMPVHLWTVYGIRSVHGEKAFASGSVAITPVSATPAMTPASRQRDADISIGEDASSSARGDQSSSAPTLERSLVAQKRLIPTSAMLRPQKPPHQFTSQQQFGGAIVCAASNVMIEVPH